MKTEKQIFLANNLFRKNLIFIGVILSFLNSFSQNFPGNSPQLLVGKDITVLEEKASFGNYPGFYKTEKLKKVYKRKSKYSSTTDKKFLSNKTFKVVSVTPYVTSTKLNKYKLELTNEEIGTIYYDYDPISDYNFVFHVIGGIEFPKEYYCNQISEDKDKFDNSITYSSSSKTVSFRRVKDDKRDDTYMSIEVFGPTINVNSKGVIILFEDQSKLELKEEKISSRVSRGGRGFMYSSFILLDESMKSKLKNNKITDVRLYIYDKEVQNGKEIQEFLKCILEK